MVCWPHLYPGRTISFKGLPSLVVTINLWFSSSASRATLAKPNPNLTNSVIERPVRLDMAASSEYALSERMKLTLFRSILGASITFISSTSRDSPYKECRSLVRNIYISHVLPLCTTLFHKHTFLAHALSSVFFRIIYKIFLCQQLKYFIIRKSHKMRPLPISKTDDPFDSGRILAILPDARRKDIAVFGKAASGRARSSAI